MKNVELELTHTHNLLSLASDCLETIIESGNTDNLSKLSSLIVKADDNLVEQLDEIVEMNLKSK